MAPASAKDDLKELAGLSQAAGRRLDWVQGAGGSTSIKHGDLLLVKAAGLRLDACKPVRGFVALDLAAVRRALDDSDGPDPGPSPSGQALLAALRPLAGADTEGLRPAPEAEFHALGARVCLHVHLVEGLAALCLDEAQAVLDAVLGPLGLDYAWADYRPPGHGLACLLRDALRHGQAPLAAMGNHGLVAWAGSADHAIAMVERVQKAFAAYFKPVQPPRLPATDADKQAALAGARRAAQEAWPGLKVCRPAVDPWSAGLAADGAWAWQAVCPDDVIHCGLEVPVLEPAQAVRPGALQGRLGAEPGVAVLGLRDHGVLIAAPDEGAWQAAHELLHANGRARALGRSRGQIRALTREQGLELRGLPAE